MPKGSAPALTTQRRSPATRREMMSDSDSDVAVSRPSVAKLEKTLRDQADKLIDKEGTSINTIRGAAENALGLSSGWFATNGKWKTESKRIVNDQIVCFHDSYLCSCLVDKSRLPSRIKHLRQPNPKPHPPSQ